MDKQKMHKSSFDGIAPHFMGFAALLVFSQTMLHYAGYPMENLLSALAAILLAALSQVAAGFTTLLHFDGLVCPMCCGLIVGCFAWMMVYMDSDVPGVRPPVPFFAEQRTRKYYPKSGGMHTNYAVAVASGLTVTLLMAWTNKKIEA